MINKAMNLAISLNWRKGGKARKTNNQFRFWAGQIIDG